MYLTANVTKWQTKKHSGGRVSALDHGSRQFILNPAYFHDITANGTGSKFYLADRSLDRRESGEYIEINESVDAIRAAYDTAMSKTVTLPVYTNNNTSKATYNITIPTDYLIYADRYNPSPVELSWVMIAENAFKIKPGLALVALSIEEILTGVSVLKDYDGNGYSTVIMGTQEWIVETLRVETYSDGTAIPELTDDAAWQADTTGAFCYYNNDADNKSNLGILYNWYAVDNAHGLAYFERAGVQEAGWRVPTYADMQALIAFIGGVANGGDLKEIGFTHWNPPNTGATDLYGFKAISGGNRYIDVPVGDGFSSFKDWGDYWTSDAIDATTAHSGYLSHASGDATWGSFGKLCGMNVRCVRDV